MEIATDVLGVWAHPDDETYLSAGLMLRARRAGAAVTVVSATAGEVGTEDPVTWPPERLAEHRAAELAAAMAQLGVDDVRLLGLPDGGLDAVPDEEGTARVAAVLRAVQPGIVVTFGPDGITGHADHRAVHRWTTRAWAALPEPGRPRLLYATTTAMFERRFRRVHLDHGLFPAGHPVVCPTAEVALELRLDTEELDRKRRALGAHASQTATLARRMGEHTFRHWWDVEAFRLPRAGEVRDHHVQEGPHAPRRRPLHPR